MTDETEPMSRSDIRDAERAFVQRWPIDATYRAAIIRRLLFIVANSKSDRAVIAASRALMAAEQQNQQDDKAEREADDNRNRFLAVAERLGINVGVERIPDKPADGDSDPIDAGNGNRVETDDRSS